LISVEPVPEPSLISRPFSEIALVVRESGSRASVLPRSTPDLSPVVFIAVERGHPVDDATVRDRLAL
jgi:hypothetical protein